MREIKKKKKTLHELKTREIFYCLSGMPLKNACTQWLSNKLSILVYCITLTTYAMSLQHARLKANALLTLDNFVAAFIKNKKNKILSNQRIDMAEILKLDEYVELNKAIAELNKFNAVNSTPEKEEKIHKALLAQIID